MKVIGSLFVFVCDFGSSFRIRLGIWCVCVLRFWVVVRHFKCILFDTTFFIFDCTANRFESCIYKRSTDIIAETVSGANELSWALVCSLDDCTLIMVRFFQSQTKSKLKAKALNRNYYFYISIVSVDSPSTVLLDGLFVQRTLFFFYYIQ